MCILNGEEYLAVAYYLFQVFLKRIKLTAQIKIVQESYALGTDINEACVESGHQLLHLCHIDVTHRERHRALLLLVFYQLLVLEQGNGDVFRLNINDYFTCHLISCGLSFKTQKGVSLPKMDQQTHSFHFLSRVTASAYLLL